MKKLYLLFMAMSIAVLSFGQTITCPGDITQNTDPGYCFATVNYANPTYDDQGSGLTITGWDHQHNGSTAHLGLNSTGTGETFPVGVSNMEIWAHLSDGDSISCTFTITVTDAEAPTALCNDLTVQLDGSGNASTTSAAVDNGSSDECPLGGPAYIHLALNDSTFTCADVGDNTVTLTVTDINGNINTCASTITVQDTVSPTAVCQDVTVVLDGTGNGSVSPAAVDNGSSDNCSLGTLNLDVSTFTCADVGANPVVLTVPDANGNSSTCNATVTVQDNTAPNALCQNVTVALDASGNGSTSATAVNNGSNDACGIADTTLSQTAFTCSDIGANTVTLTVTDNNTNTNTCTAIVTVQDNISPVAACQDVTVQLDGSGNGSLAAADVDNGSSDNCGFTSGLNTTSFSCSDVGSTTVTLTVTDDGGNTDACTANVTVQDTVSPTAICQDITVQLDAGGAASIVAGDIDNGSNDACGLETLSIDVSSFSCSDVGSPVTVTLTVPDIHSNSSTCTGIVTVEDNVAPTALCQSVTVQLDASGNGTTTAAAVDNGSSDACGIASMSLSQAAFTCTDLGGNSVTLSVTDVNGNTGTCAATVTVEDNIDPTAVCQDITVQLDENGAATADPGDVDNGSTDNCSITSLSLDQTAFDCGDLGDNPVVLTVSDGSGNTDSCPATVTVEDNLPPTAICLDTVRFYLDSNGSVEVDAKLLDDGSTDNCSPDSLKFGLLRGNIFTCDYIGVNNVTLNVEDKAGNLDQCLSNVLILDTLAPVVSCLPLTVELDSSGNYALTQANVDAINDTHPQNGTKDNCTGFADLVFAVAPNTYTCADIGDVPVVLSVTDLSGNTGTCSTTVTVEDNIIPVPQCQDVTVYLSSDVNNGNATITAIGGSPTVPQIDDGSWDNCALTYTLDNYNFTCADECQNPGDPACPVVTLTVTDEAGNTAQCTATVTVVDTVNPTPVCQDVDVYLDASGNGTITVSDVDNGSVDNCAIDTMWLSKYDFTCVDVCTNICSGGGSPGLKSAQAPPVLTPCQMVTLYVKDVNGNIDSCQSTITVHDDIIPDAQCKDITVDLDNVSSGTGAVSITPAMINNNSTDACGIESLALSNEDFDCADVCLNLDGLSQGACPTVTLTVTDVNCNTNTCTAMVTVRDADAPQVMCQDVSVYLDASGHATITATGSGTNVIDAGTWDNCAIDTWSLTRTDFYCADNVEYFPLGVEVTMTVTDIHGNDSTCTSNVFVYDTIAPVITCQDVTVYLSDEEMNGNATITADKDNPGVSVNFENVLASWIDNCDITTMLDVSTFTCENVGANAVLVTATDEGGNQGTCSAVVTVVDDKAPHVITQDVTVCLDESGNYTLTTDTIDNGSWDNCGIDTYELDRTAFACVDTGVHVVTLTVTDVNGNSASNSANVTIKDCDPPVVNAIPLTVHLYENGEYVLTDVDIEYISRGTVDNPTWDNCTPYEQMKIEIFPQSFECVHVYEPVPIVVYATDVSGNLGTDTTWVTVLDTLKPVMDCVDSLDVYLDEFGAAWISPGQLNFGNDRESVPEWARTYNNLEGGSYDACGIDSAWVSMPLFNCGDVGANVVTLSMLDPSWNLGTCTSVVNVMDTFPPTLAPVADITVEVEPGTCETAIDYPVLNASDNCEVVLSLSEGLGTDGMFPLGASTETWVATDAGGNTATVSFTVTVTTTNAPPTLDDIDDVTADEDTPPVNVPFSGVSFGVDCEAQDISVTATGDNPDLVTSITVNYTSADATGSLDLTVAPDMSGTALITVNVIDSEGASVSKAFKFTVNPVNDPPFLVNPIADQTLNASKELTVTISSVLGDVFDDIDDASLAIDVMLEGGGDLPAWATISGDVLTLKPMIADTGCVNVIVTATDAAGASVSDTFTVCVEGYPVSVIEIGQDVFEVEMYPNPTRGKVNLELNAGQIYDVDLTVTDITGKMVYRHQYSAAERITFDMSDKVSGMYFVQLEVEGKQIVKKLIVDRQ